MTHIEKHRIAYKDCKTETDYRFYCEEKEALAKARLAAFDLQSEMIAAGLIELLPELNALIDKICDAETAYSKDETDEIQASILNAFEPNEK